MNLSDMRALVRRDLKDESSPYRWSDDELDRHIARAVKDLSERVPLPARATIATVADSWDIDVSAVTNRIMAVALEYPTGEVPRLFQRFSIWGDTLTIISGTKPDGSNCYFYYGKLHTLAGTSTIPPKHEDLVATGAAGHAAVSWGAYAINRVNVGGGTTPKEFLAWGKDQLRHFREELTRLGRRSRLRSQQLNTPLL